MKNTVSIDRESSKSGATHLITNPEEFGRVTGMPLLLSKGAEMREVIERVLESGSAAPVLERARQLQRLEQSADPVLVEVGGQIDRIVRELRGGISSAIIEHGGMAGVPDDVDPQDDPFVVAHEKNGFFVQPQGVPVSEARIRQIAEEMRDEFLAISRGVGLKKSQRIKECEGNAVLVYPFTNVDVDPKALPRAAKAKSYRDARLELLERDNLMLVRVRPHQFKGGKRGFPALMMTAFDREHGDTRALYMNTEAEREYFYDRTSSRTIMNMC